MVESIRKWKYATFAVLGVLALVIVTPTAFAAPSGGGSDISKIVLDILKNSQTLLTQSSSISSTTITTQNAVTDAQSGLPAIKGQLEELPSKIYGSQVISEAVAISSGDGKIIVTSDRDFTVCYVLSNPFAPELPPKQLRISITQGEITQSHLWFVQGGRPTDSACLGADAGGTIEFETISDSIFAFVTLTTSADADARIIEPVGN